MKIFKNLCQGSSPKLAVLRHPVKACKAWQFSEVRLLNYFGKKGIYAHPQYISKEHFLKPLMNSMEIDNAGDARKLARYLKGLYIKELIVEHDVDLSKSVISKMRLWYYLETFIDQRQILGKMVIRRHAPDKCFIENNTSLIVSQVEGFDHTGHEGEATDK